MVTKGLFYVVMGCEQDGHDPVFVTTDKEEAEKFCQGANEAPGLFAHLRTAYEYYRVATVDQSYLE